LRTREARDTFNLGRRRLWSEATVNWHSHSAYRNHAAMLVAGVSAALLAAVSFAPAAGAESSSPWTVQPSPNPTGTLASGLAAVSCPAAGRCVAVGGSSIPSGGQVPNTALLVEQLSDGTWTIASTPAISGAKSTDLSDVSCPTTGFCVAVGSVQYGHRPPGLLAETWNGTSWHARVLPNPPGGNLPSLLAVSCAAQGSCVAVGNYVGDKTDEYRPLAMRLAGTAWSVLPAPIPPHGGGGTGNSEYTDVDCTTATLCETVGLVGYNDTLQAVFAYSLNGATFTFQRQVNPGPDPGDTDAAVSCSATGACTSVGYMQVIGEEALAEHWDGSTWARQATPFPAKRAADALYDTSCDGGSSCVAVGESWVVDPHNGHLIDPRVMGEVWNGTAWSQSQPVVPSGVSAGLSGISCTSPTACIAVGGASTATSESTLVEAYTG
jgi:hypothetical protein